MIVVPSQHTAVHCECLLLLYSNLSLLQAGAGIDAFEDWQARAEWAGCPDQWYLRNLQDLKNRPCGTYKT